MPMSLEEYGRIASELQRTLSDWDDGVVSIESYQRSTAGYLILWLYGPGAREHSLYVYCPHPCRIRASSGWGGARLRVCAIADAIRGVPLNRLLLTDERAGFELRCGPIHTKLAPPPHWLEHGTETLTESQP